MDIREGIIQFIRANGPSLPVKIAKEINTNIIMASAYLSELSSGNKIKISSIKVGGSPLYYLPGQEQSLQKFIENLNVREKEVYTYLYQKKVVKDSELQPVQRVAIRAIKDFAIPLYFNSELFWKWYLLSNNEVEACLKPKEDMVKRETPKPEPKIEVAIKEVSGERQERIPKKEPIIERTDILKKPYNYFNKNKIEIIEQTIVRKNSEADFIIKLPSAVGELMYYCKFKGKQRINEGDLSSAYLQSQTKKLPLFFLTNGELTKKAKEMIDKELKGINVRKI